MSDERRHCLCVECYHDDDGCPLHQANGVAEGAQSENKALATEIARLRAQVAAAEARWGELRARLHQLAPFDRDAAIEALDRMDAAHPMKVVKVVVPGQVVLKKAIMNIGTLSYLWASDTADLLSILLQAKKDGESLWLVKEVSDE